MRNFLFPSAIPGNWPRGNAPLGAILCILLAMAAGCASTRPARQFQFVVWGDSQFDNPATFERAVRETSLLHPAFVLHVGDMIHGYHSNPGRAQSEWQQFRQQIAPLQAPFYPTPGNHDLTTEEMRPIYGEAWGRKPYYYSFDFLSAHFIVLDAFDGGEFYKFSDAQRKWLERDLERHRSASAIFVSLHPPLQMRHGSAPGDYKEYAESWNWLHPLLCRYPVRAVFTGHAHVYDYVNIDGIDYFCLNSSGRITLGPDHAAGRSHQYLIVSMASEGGDAGRPHYAIAEPGHIWGVEDVPASEWARTGAWMEEDSGVTIPDPSRGPVDAVVRVPVRNRAAEERTFALRWEIPDARWSFAPQAADVRLDPGTSRTLEFRVRGPRGEFKRGDLPRLRCESPWRNSAGVETSLAHYVHLFVPPETAAQTPRGAWVFDGKTDDPAWRGVPAIAKFQTDTLGTPAPEVTEVKILYDDRYLYFGVWGEEPNPKGLSAGAHGKLPLVFGDDDFEFFLQPNLAGRDYFRIMANSKGTKFCSSPKGLFSYDYDVKTFVGTNFWSAEFRVPFSAFGVSPPRAGDVWGLNVRRHRTQAAPVQRDWSKMDNHPPQLYYFGRLRFEK